MSEKARNRTAMATLVRLIRVSLRKRETRIMKRDQWEKARQFSYQHDTDIVSGIAESAGADWLLHNETGEARFFEFA